jgi:hypothetical protein
VTSSFSVAWICEEVDCRKGTQKTQRKNFDHGLPEFFGFESGVTWGQNVPKTDWDCKSQPHALCVSVQVPGDG